MRQHQLSRIGRSVSNRSISAGSRPPSEATSEKGHINSDGNITLEYKSLQVLKESINESETGDNQINKHNVLGSIHSSNSKDVHFNDVPPLKLKLSNQKL